MSGAGSLLTGLVRRVARAQDREIPATAWAFAQFFLLLSCNYLLRSARESFGSERGSIDLNWLYTGTFVMTLVATSAWAALVARFPVRRFLAIGYQFFAASFLVFWTLLTFAPEARSQIAVKYVFFVWYSAYNVFAVSIFWSRMADLFSHEQGRRLFPFVASGGSLGAIAGSAVSASLGKEIGTVNLLLGAALILQAVIFCSRRLAGAASGVRSPGGPAPAETVEAPPSLREAFGVLTRSRLLMLVAAYILFATFCGTFVYTMQSDVARRAYPDADARTEYFGTLDLAVNVIAFLGAVFVAPRIIAWIGVGAALFLLPSTYVLGFGAVSLNPVLIAVAALQIAYRSVGYGVTTPARETIFTVVSRDAKYRAKNAIDTAVWRFGDLVSIWILEVVLWAGPGERGDVSTKVALIAAFGIPLALFWLFTATRLRAEHTRVAEIRSVP